MFIISLFFSTEISIKLLLSKNKQSAENFSETVCPYKLYSNSPDEKTLMLLSISLQYPLTPQLATSFSHKHKQLLSKHFCGFLSLSMTSPSSTIGTFLFQPTKTHP